MKENLKGLCLGDQIELLHVAGLNLMDGKWSFCDEDPQIYLKFRRPIRGIRIYVNIGRGNIENSVTTIYYKISGEEYSEKNTCHIDFKCNTAQTNSFLFDEDIEEVRIDPVECAGECVVNTMSIEVIDQYNIAEPYLKVLDTPTEKKKEKIVIMTDTISKSSHSVFVQYLSKKFCLHEAQIVVLTMSLEDKSIYEQYRQEGILLIGLEPKEFKNIHCISLCEGVESEIDISKFVCSLIVGLRNRGFFKLISCGMRCGKYMQMFKDYNFKILTLVHETEKDVQLFDLFNEGKSIALYSDYVVCSTKKCKNGFEQLYSQYIRGECMIRNGFMSVLREVADTNGEEAVLGRLRIKKGDYVILASGTASLRRGIDLFVLSANLLVEKYKEQLKNIHFVWVGEFENESLAMWIRDQIEKSDMSQYIDIIHSFNSVEEYKAVVKRADIYWTLNRQESDPALIYDVLYMGTCIVGFEKTGVADELLSRGNGYLVEPFRIDKVAELTKTILLSEKEQTNVDRNEATQGYVKDFSLDDYCIQLWRILDRDYVIKPDLDLYKWGKRTHFYEKQNNGVALEERKEQVKRKRRWMQWKQPELVEKNKIVLLDTAIDSDNIGDEIIMDYCMQACEDFLENREVLHIPTHSYDPQAEHIEPYFKILCGTNLIYTQMECSRQWALPNKMSNLKHICLLGAGMQQLGIDQPISQYTKDFWNYVLDKNVLHSVRDKQTKIKLAEMGITNVINTGCPTMWRLTETFCNSIPRGKARSVISTVTDYMPDIENDKYMLETLKKNYEHVYIWIQGQKDFEYLRNYIDISKFILIPPSLEKLDEVLDSDESLDYIGTRLHAGIRALNKKRRTLIISIDNRARAIADDTNLPILERGKLKDRLTEEIYQERVTKIHIPENEIERWKGQFKLS